MNVLRTTLVCLYFLFYCFAFSDSFSVRTGCPLFLHTCYLKKFWEYWELSYQCTHLKLLVSICCFCGCLSACKKLNSVIHSLLSYWNYFEVRRTGFDMIYDILLKCLLSIFLSFLSTHRKFRFSYFHFWDIEFEQFRNPIGQEKTKCTWKDKYQLFDFMDVYAYVKYHCHNSSRCWPTLL